MHIKYKIIKHLIKHFALVLQQIIMFKKLPALIFLMKTARLGLWVFKVKWEF